MYYGKQTEKIKNLSAQYENLFGYDPDGEMELEYSNESEYVSLLEECIHEKKDMFTVLGI